MPSLLIDDSRYFFRFARSGDKESDPLGIIDERPSESNPPLPALRVGSHCAVTTGGEQLHLVGEDGCGVAISAHTEQNKIQRRLAIGMRYPLGQDLCIAVGLLRWRLLSANTMNVLRRNTQGL